MKTGTRKMLQKVPTYIEGLDEILNGGFPSGRTTLLFGAPGNGKTIFAENICKQNEKVLYLSFEESPDALMHNIKSAGVNLDIFKKSNNLFYIFGTMPEATGIEEHLFKLMDNVEKIKPDHVIIDAISACERIGGKGAAY